MRYRLEGFTGSIVQPWVAEFHKLEKQWEELQRQVALPTPGNVAICITNNVFSLAACAITMRVNYVGNDRMTKSSFSFVDPGEAQSVVLSQIDRDPFKGHVLRKSNPYLID